MNFLEAVQALANGECEGIRRLGGYATITLSEGCLQDCYKDARNILANDFILVNPIPKTENREVKRWMIRESDGNITGIPFATYKQAENYCENCKIENANIIELTGFVEVPIPRKVKRRMDISEVVGCGHFTVNGVLIPKDAKTFAEWEEEV